MLTNKIALVLIASLLSWGANARDPGRFVCVSGSGQRYYASEHAKGCEEIPLQKGWTTFVVIPPALVDVDPRSLVTEPDGKTIRVHFRLADIADDVDGKWKYDELESSNKFLCGKRMTRLDSGTYRLGGKVVHERSSSEAVTESVDPGTLNEALYVELCEQK